MDTSGCSTPDLCEVNNDYIFTAVDGKKITLSADEFAKSLPRNSKNLGSLSLSSQVGPKVTPATVAIFNGASATIAAFGAPNQVIVNSGTISITGLNTGTSVIDGLKPVSKALWTINGAGVPVTDSSGNPVLVNGAQVLSSGVTSINLQKNTIGFGAGFAGTILDTTYPGAFTLPSPTSTTTTSFTVLNNTFQGNQADIKIRNNKDLQIINRLAIGGNNIHGAGDTSKAIKNIEFICPDIAPTINQSTIAYSTNNVYPVVFVLDRDNAGLVGKDTKIETIYADMPNITNTINNTAANLIQFKDYNTSNATINNGGISLTSAINLKNDQLVFGIGTDPSLKNQTNYDVNYKVFTNAANQTNAFNGGAPTSNDCGLLKSKPKINITGDGIVNLKNNNTITGLNVSASNLNAQTFLTPGIPGVLHTSTKTAFRIPQLATSTTINKNYFTITGPDSNMFIVENKAGNTTDFTKNYFNVSGGTISAGSNGTTTDAIYFVDDPVASSFSVTRSNPSSLNATLEPRMLLKNNTFETPDSTPGNNAIGINAPNVSSTNTPRFIPSLTVIDLVNGLVDAPANVFNKFTTSFNDIAINGQDIIHYAINKPFTAYFQFDAMNYASPSSFGFNSDADFRTIPAPNSSTISGNPTTNPSSTPTNSTLAAYPIPSGLYTPILTSTFTKRFADWKDFGALNLVDLNANDDLQVKLASIPSMITSRPPLILLNNNISNPISLKPITSTLTSGSTTDALKPGQYIVGDKYRFGICAESEDYTLTNEVYFDLANMNAPKFNPSSITIPVLLSNLATPLVSIANDGTSNQTNALIGLNFDLKVTNIPPFPKYSSITNDPLKDALHQKRQN